MIVSIVLLTSFIWKPLEAQQNVGCQNKIRQLQNKQLSFLKNITTLAKALDSSNKAAKNCINQLKICNQYNSVELLKKKRNFLKAKHQLNAVLSIQTRDW